jgi:hypothetical protein
VLGLLDREVGDDCLGEGCERGIGDWTVAHGVGVERRCERSDWRELERDNEGLRVKG